MGLPITNHLNNDLANPQSWEEFCTAASERFNPTSFFNMAKENAVMVLESNLLSVAGFGVGSLFGMGVVGSLITEATGMVLLSEFNSKTLNWSDLSKKMFEGIATSGLIYGAWTMASYLAIPLPVKLIMFPAAITLGNLITRKEEVTTQYGLALGVLEIGLSLAVLAILEQGSLRGFGSATKSLIHAGDSTPNTRVDLDKSGQIISQRRIHVVGTTDRLSFMAYTHEGYPAKVLFNPSELNKLPNGDNVLVWFDGQNSWIGVADGVSGSHRGDEAAFIALEAAQQKTVANPHLTPFDVISEAHDVITKQARGNYSGTTTLQVIKINPYNQADYALVGDGRSFVYRAHGESFELFSEDPSIHRYRGARAPGQLGIKNDDLISMYENERHQLSICQVSEVAVRLGSTKLNKGDRIVVTTDGLPGVIPEGLRNRSDVSLVEWGTSIIRLAEERQEILWKWVIRRRKGIVQQLETDRIQIAEVGWVGRFEDRFFIYSGQTGGQRIRPFDPDNLGVVFAEITQDAKPPPPPPQRTSPASDWGWGSDW